MKLDNWKHSNITLDLVYHDNNTITATLADTIDGERYKLIEDMTDDDLFNLAEMCEARACDIRLEQHRLEQENNGPLIGLSVEDRQK